MGAQGGGGYGGGVYIGGYGGPPPAIGGYQEKVQNYNPTLNYGGYGPSPPQYGRYILTLINILCGKQWKSR